MKKPKCRLCNAAFQYQFIRANYVFGDNQSKYKFWQCRKCNLVYLWPIPSHEEENIFYAQEFEKFMKKRTGEDRDWSSPEVHIQTNQDQVKRRWKYLKNDLKKGLKVLEIGCSSGFMMDFFRKEGLHPIGIEPSGCFSKFLTDRGHIHYNSIDELLDYNPTIKFDLIVHFFVLEHIRNTKAFLQQQLELLKPGGKIIAEVPNVNDPLTSLYNIPAFERFYWSIAHHYYFSPESLSPVLDALNCEYKFVLEQRYDLSNHIVWLQDGKPGGQGRFNSVFSKETLENYKNDLISKRICDTFFLYLWRA